MLISVGLSGSITFWNLSFGFLEGAHNRGLPSNPTIYTTSPFSDEDWHLVWLVVVHFTCPMISFVPHYCQVSTFHHPSQFFPLMFLFFIIIIVVLLHCPNLSPLALLHPSHKSRTFSLCLSGESHVEMLSRRVFLLNLCRPQTSK